ncbi:MAG: geranylgeranyl reductase family protein [Ardenticatenaceae bacterium]|nr:geranylgeranyl reductase family protein [Ardenticatenaceae bacterium]
MNSVQQQDVIIIGAGPSGATAAYFLAQAGLQVLLLDKATFPREKTCGDGLTPRAIGVLEELGLVDDIRREGCQMDEATVFAPNGSKVTTQMPERDDVPSMMLAIPRLKLDNLILQKALSAGAHLLEGFNVQDVEMQENGVTVIGRQNGRTTRVHGRMGIIAVGAGMGLLKRLGILKETPLLTLAARTYYEDIQDLSGRFEFYFEGIPLPGYGWIFPLSETTANIGAGIFEVRGRSRQQSAQAVLEQFIQLPKVKHMLAHAKQVGPVRGFPIRTDFARAPTYAQNVLLVGEAAGLVNPLTGEGIDYALESGKMAAEQMIQMFAAADFSVNQLQNYDKKLRDHFHSQVVFCERIRDWYLHKPIINRLVRVAQRRDQFRELFTDIVLGNVAAKEAMNVKTVLQILFT